MNFDAIQENWPHYLEGAWITLQLLAISLALGLSLAIPLAVLRVSRAATDRDDHGLLHLVARDNPDLLVATTARGAGHCCCVSLFHISISPVFALRLGFDLQGASPEQGLNPRQFLLVLANLPYSIDISQHLLEVQAKA